MPTGSLRIVAASRVEKSGAVKLSETAFATGIRASDENQHSIEIRPSAARQP